MNPFTISHRSCPPPPLAGAPPTAASAGGGLACSGPAPRADIWLARSVATSRHGIFKLKAKGGTESHNVVVTKRKTEKKALLASDTGAEEEVGPKPLVDARSGEELLSYVRNRVENGNLSPDITAKLEELYFNYENAVMQSANPNAREIILHNMAIAFDRMLLEAEDPFTFPPLHKAIREPFDYYSFGQNYIRPLVDFRNSYVGNIHVFQDMEEKLQQGHNVILMSNHQSEADPAIIALLLERTFPRIAENIVYVAGDRVITDLLCKPFSMGRNLICVYSKKHMNDEPELTEMKRRSNTRSLKEMALLLRGGSQIIWIAPSGGRDRPDPTTGEWHPAQFDSASVDNMRRLCEHCGVTGHIYPLTLLCHEVMPPPPQVEKQIGEERKISFHGVGLSAGPEMNYKQLTSHCSKGEKGREVFCKALHDSVMDQYKVLNAAIYGNNGLDASSDSVSLSQPWLS